MLPLSLPLSLSILLHFNKFSKQIYFFADYIGLVVLRYIFYLIWLQIYGNGKCIITVTVIDNSEGFKMDFWIVLIAKKITFLVILLVYS